MKPMAACIVLLIFILSPGCSKYRVGFLREKNKIIAIQPLGDFDSLQTVLAAEEIGHFFNRKVVVLKPVSIPPAYMKSAVYNLYIADSILNFLSSLINDSITEVVGLTDVTIYTSTESVIKERADSPEINIVFGMSRLPGNVCVVSDHRLKDTDPLVLRHRIKTVALHEMGHNLGLTHCPSSKCIMSDANGNTAILDKNENYYCSRCKKRLR